MSPKSQNVWEQRKLGEIAEEVKGNSGSINNIPILTISAANGWMNQKDRFSQIIAGNELKKYTLLKKGELSYNHGNSKLAKYGTVFVQDSHDKALVPRVYHSFKMVAQNNPYFIEYLFASGLPNKELSKIVTSGARMDGLLNINKKEFFSIKLNNPSSEEQSSVAKLFQSLDKTITLHEEKQRQLERLKKALLQKMFADETGYPMLRFKGFTEKWEQVKLSKTSRSYSGGTPKVGVHEYYDGQIPFIRSGEIASKSTELTISETGLNNSSAKLVSKGDILYALYGATSGEVSLSKINGAINQAILAIKPIDGYENYFLMTWLQKEKEQITRTYLQGGQGNLSAKIVMNLVVNIPSLSEQSQIAQIFSKLDKTITLHDKKIQYLKQLKRGLLQKMFV